MSYPQEFDAAIIYTVVGSGGTAVRTVLCGIEDVSINEVANTTDRFRTDCAKPGAIPTRSVRVNSTQWDVTGSGVTNATDVAARKSALGQHLNYEIDAIRYDGTDEGEVLGTFAGPGVLTSSNNNMQRQGDSGSEVTIAGEGELIWTPAA